MPDEGLVGAAAAAPFSKVLMIVIHRKFNNIFEKVVLLRIFRLRWNKKEECSIRRRSAAAVGIENIRKIK